MLVRRYALHFALACTLAGGWAAARWDGASATTTGGGSFAGTVDFGSGFPCSTCAGGVLAATAAISLSGVSQGGNAYSAEWPDARSTAPGTLPINLSSNFTYSGTCEVSNGLPAVLGSAGGPFTLSGGLLVLNGSAWDNATLTGTFLWQQLGPDEAAVSLMGLSISGGPGPSQVAVNLNLNNVVVGEGVVSFASPSGMGTCQNQQTSVTALITGSLAQPA
jgi:hypothetical protein